MKLTIKKDRSFMSFRAMAQIYILLYVLVMYCGNSFLLNIASGGMTLVAGLLFLLTTTGGGTRHAYLNREFPILWFIMGAFTLFLVFQIIGDITYNEVSTRSYVNRYIVYTALLIFVPTPEITAATIRMEKRYAVLCGISIILMTLVTGEKAGGLLGDYQAAGMLMSLSCFIFMASYFTEENNASSLICYLLSLLCVLISGKRTFSVLSIASFVIVYLFMRKKIRGKQGRLLGVFTLVCIVGIVSYAVIPQVQDLVTRIMFSSNSEDYSSGRDVLWRWAREIYKKHYVAGIGFGAFPAYTKLYYSWDPHAGLFHTHNIYFGLLADTGTIGTTLYLLFMSIGFVKSVKCLKSVKNSTESHLYKNMMYSVVVQIWFILYGFSGNGVYDTNEAFLYVTAIAIMISTKIYLRKKAIERREQECVSEIK